MAGLLWNLAGALGIIWLGGSVGIACFRPWRHLEPGEGWMGFVFVLAWLPLALWMLGSLVREWRLDRRDARKGRVHRG